LLHCFSSLDYQASLKKNRKKRHGLTYSWLMVQREYQDCRDSAKSSLFWLKGGDKWSLRCGELFLIADDGFSWLGKKRPFVSGKIQPR
jgi:hypothetical protein